MIISKQKFEIEKNKAYFSGYEKGKTAGIREGILKYRTKDEIREILGFPPLKKSEKE